MTRAAGRIAVAAGIRGARADLARRGSAIDVPSTVFACRGVSRRQERDGQPVELE
jgi:hypothetical protein